MDHDLDKKIKRAGFEVNAYKEVRTYIIEDSGVAKISNRTLSPLNYKYDGSIWAEMELPLFERLFCLMRLPELQFEQLWELFISTRDKDDEIGSLSLILNKYNRELLAKLKEYQEQNNLNKIEKKKLRMLQDFIAAETSMYKESIQDILRKKSSMKAYAPYWKQILALLVDGVVGYISAIMIYLGIRYQFSVNYMTVAFITTYFLQAFFYYCYGNKSFGDHVLRIEAQFVRKNKSRLYNAIAISFGKTIMVVPFGFPVFGLIIALMELLITTVFLFIPSYRVKKCTGWNYGIAYMVESNKSKGSRVSS